MTLSAGPLIDFPSHHHEHALESARAPPPCHWLGGLCTLITLLWGGGGQIDRWPCSTNSMEVVGIEEGPFEISGVHSDQK